MKLRLLLLVFLSSIQFNVLLAGPPDYIQTRDGVIVFTHPVFTGSSNAVKLEVVSDNIIRVIQFGAFVPLFRSHGQFPYREIFNTAPDDHPAYTSFLYYDKLRYRLMPYIYSSVGAAYHDNYTITQGLVMDFSKYRNVLNIGDQYLFGPSLFINPVYEYKQRSRKLYLPKNAGWYDLYSGKWHAGGEEINANAPYDRMPVLVKAGSIIPFGPELQYTSEKFADTITLNIYNGADAIFNLYEDEGTNYTYEKGAFSIIPIKYNEATKTITIGDRKGIP